MRNPLASAAARRVCASAVIANDKAKRHNANQFIRRSMEGPPFELSPQSHKATENVTEHLSFDLLCVSVSLWQSRFTYPRNPRNLDGKRSMLTNTSLASASGRPSQRANVLPY